MENDLRPRLIPISREDQDRRAWGGFGLGLGIMSLVLAWRYRAHGHASAVLCAVALTATALSRLRPDYCRPLYRLWMPVVGVLARINLWLISAVIYYGVVTPYGLLLRCIGFRPLELAMHDKDSYWEAKPPRDPAESSRRIF